MSLSKVYGGGFRDSGSKALGSLSRGCRLTATTATTTTTTTSTTTIIIIIIIIIFIYLATRPGQRLSRRWPPGP